MKLVVVVQARLGSTRLPGKVLEPILGQPMLARQLERIRGAEVPFETVVAIPYGPDDDPLEALCATLGVACFRGHPTDLLDRHYQAGRAWGADAVAKIPSDCPLIDPGVIDRVLRTYLQAPQSYDFVSNLHPPSYPDGNDVEVMSMAALTTAWAEATRPHEREHTTAYLWDQPERFRTGNVRWETGQDLSSSVRLTVDHPEDLALVRAIYEGLYRPSKPFFTVDEVVAFLDTRPDVRQLNAAYLGQTWIQSVGDAFRIPPEVST